MWRATRAGETLNAALVHVFADAFDVVAQQLRLCWRAGSLICSWLSSEWLSQPSRRQSERPKAIDVGVARARMPECLSSLSSYLRYSAVRCMSRELERLETQLRLSFEGPAWHGPSVIEALEGVSAEAASEHPIAGAHSIWELVLHLTGSYQLVLRRLEGDGRPLSPDEDWAPVPGATASSWQDAIRTLRELNEQVRRAVIHFDSERLDEPLVTEPPYSAYTQFIGLTQHDLYHAGQIMLLKRAMEDRRVK
jgi:uncharacterized damage-inducible protein DinB